MLRSSVLQNIQIGAEVTPGTAVAAGKRLQCLFVDPRPRIPTTPHRSAGSKFNQGMTRQKQHTEANVTGVLAFNDIVYMLAGLISKPTAPTWAFLLAPFAPQAIQTFSVEVGSSAQADKFNYGFFTSMEFEATQREITVRGTMVGRKFGTGATMTATPADVPKVLADPAQVDVYLDTDPDPAVLLDICSEVRFGIRNPRGPAFSFNSAQPSFRGDVERAGDWTAQIVVEQSAVADGYLDYVVNKDLLYLKTVVTGPEFGVGTPYRFTSVHPVNFLEPDPRADREGVLSGVYNLLPVYDLPSAGVGSGASFLVETDMAAL